MEHDKYISLGDSYIEIQSNEKELLQFIDEISKGKIILVLSTKSLPEITVKVNEKESEK